MSSLLSSPEQIFSTTQRTLLEVGNTNVLIFEAPPYLQNLIDFFTRYPTDLATAQSDGWKPPEHYVGDEYWDGWVHLARFPRQGPAHVPTGLFDLVKWVCDRYGFPYDVVDTRVRPMEGMPDYFEPIVDRDYQLEAVRIALEEGRGVLDMPPRSGKTRTMTEIHRQVALPTIWIAPTSNVVKQTVRVLEGFFGNNYAVQLVGTKTWKDVQHHRVVVCTAATARKLPPEFYATREMLVIDEFHHAAARTYHDIALKCPHIYYRFGMTGTFFRSGDDALGMHAVLSKTIFKIGTAELLERGYLVPTDVAYIPVEGPRAKGGPTYHAGCGKYGIFQHDRRTELAAWAAELLHFNGRKVLVLVGTKAQGYAIEELLKHKFPSGKLEFVSTDRPAPICQDVIDRFAKTDQIEVLIGTSMVGEGTDLPPADALVYAAGQKAEVQLVQAAFRVCTKTPGKERAILVDFADRHHKTLMDHSLERLSVFWKEDTFDVTILDAPENLDGWVASRTG